MNRKVLYLSETCEKLHVSRPKLYRLLKAGEMLLPRYLGQTPFWFEDEIDEWLDSIQQEVPTSKHKKVGKL